MFCLGATLFRPVLPYILNEARASGAGGLPARRAFVRGLSDDSLERLAGQGQGQGRAQAVIQDYRQRAAEVGTGGDRWGPGGTGGDSREGAETRRSSRGLTQRGGDERGSKVRNVYDSSRT